MTRGHSDAILVNFLHESEVCFFLSFYYAFVIFVNIQGASSAIKYNNTLTKQDKTQINDIHW